MITTTNAPNDRQGGLIEQATPYPNGQVGYDVTRVGRFTIGYGSHRRHSAHVDAGCLIVTYGHDTGDDSYGTWALQRPKAPTLFGITLVGMSIVDTDDVMAYLAAQPDRRSSWWITPHRHDKDGHLVEVPDGTRRHIARLVAALIEDYLDRPDAEQLLIAHRHRHAAERVVAARARLAQIDHEIELWNRIRRRELDALADQEALARGEVLCPSQLSPVRRDPGDRRWQPLTSAGELYLRASGLSADGTTV